MHPDVNNSPDANENFIALYEAFVRLSENSKRPVAKPERTNAYEEASKASRMKYEAWIRSDQYKQLTHIVTLGDFLITTLLFCIIILLTSINGWCAGGKVGLRVGLAAGILIVVFLGRKKFLGKYFTPLQALKAIGQLVTFKQFVLFLLSVVNIVTFLRIGLFTLIPLSILLCLYGVLFLFACLIKYKSNSLSFVYAKSTLLLSLVSLLLCLNFFFSKSPSKEIDYFDKKVQEDTLLEFNHNELKDYSGVRFFFFIDNEHGKPIAVEYHLEKGLLGYRVVKNYTFVKAIP